MYPIFFFLFQPHAPFFFNVRMRGERGGESFRANVVLSRKFALSGERRAPVSKRAIGYFGGSGPREKLHSGALNKQWVWQCCRRISFTSYITSVQRRLNGVLKGVG